MINRKIKLIFIMFLFLGLCYIVASYTIAEVNNSLVITISSSEDALIAMPEEIDLDITKEIINVTTLMDKEQDISINTDGDENTEEVLNIGQEFSYEVKTETFISINYNSNDFYIKNNMNNTIDIYIDISDKSIKANPKTVKKLNPGECQQIRLYVGDDIESKECEMTIYAAWDMGSAEIYKIINVNVETISTAKTVDLRKPKEMLIPVVDEENNIQDIQQSAMMKENEIIDTDSNLNIDKNYIGKPDDVLHNEIIDNEQLSEERKSIDGVKEKEELIDAKTDNNMENNNDIYSEIENIQELYDDIEF